ncbi:MAG: hypothetical protein ACLR4Z_13230, partial [Butyricicoccaceae bacterium]
STEEAQLPRKGGGSSMVSRVFSAGIDGINGYIVTVECLLSGGLPRLDVVDCRPARSAKPESACAPPRNPARSTGLCRA